MFLYPICSYTRYVLIPGIHCNKIMLTVKGLSPSQSPLESPLASGRSAPLELVQVPGPLPPLSPHTQPVRRRPPALVVPRADSVSVVHASIK